MLITIIALRSLWLAWCVRQHRRAARSSLRELTEFDLTHAIDEQEIDAPFWRVVQAGFRRQVSSSERKRARMRQAVSRLSRISERKLTRGRALQIGARCK
jgi:hypothetical protein